ncbi:NADH dehydrogenase [ubiquinone] 1 alpha subcomplex subunit 1-like [Calliopsis andreniformis]|uniref:NADH dehydrogenase [ubiquinone] 1 alpha subcomplex subunit 1-like n=1 Tax=Calliopsis andreniformis TaxID=337506 RepID=UPI003FCD083A
MWYEILPCVGIMATCLSLPQILQYYGNSWVFGNPMRRNLNSSWDSMMFERDERISNGAPWKTVGLENIPDK